MEAAELIERYPRVYHMAEDHSWPSIERHGLLSTSALLDLYEISGAARRAIESARRASSVTITHQRHGTAVVRDQKPMHESALARCLDDEMTPAQWYRLLNAKVFFWPTEERLQGMLNARPYRDLSHTVLTVDTEQLLARHEGKVWLAPINSGSTLYNPSPRGRHTFRRIGDYPFEERRRARGWANAVAEIAVDRSVPDIATCVVRVDRRRGDHTLAVIFVQ